ncbi:hypothetical protein HK099_002474, partial [Clydaea vesicula]
LKPHIRLQVPLTHSATSEAAARAAEKCGEIFASHKNNLYKRQSHIYEREANNVIPMDIDHLQHATSGRTYQGYSNEIGEITGFSPCGLNIRVPKSQPNNPKEPDKSIISVHKLATEFKNGLPIYDFKINETIIPTIIDSGASANVIAHSVQQKLGSIRTKTNCVMQSANGMNELIRYATKLLTNDDEEEYLCANLRKDQAILGYPWLKAHNAQFNWNDDSITYTNTANERKTVMPRQKRDISKSQEVVKIMMTETPSPETSEDNDATNIIMMLNWKSFAKGLRKKTYEAIYEVNIADTLSTPNTELDKNLFTEKPPSEVARKVAELKERFPHVFPLEPKITGVAGPRKILELAGSKELEEIRKLHLEISNAQLIRPSNSPWSSVLKMVVLKLYCSYVFYKCSFVTLNLLDCSINKSLIT